MWISLALTTQAAMIGCLFFSWQAKKQHKNILRLGAFLAMAVCVYAWYKLVNWEYGVSYFFIANALCAWILILSVSIAKNKGLSTRKLKHKDQKNLSVNPKAVGLFVLRLLFYIVVIGSVSALSSIAISYDLPFGEPEQMTVATFLFPCLWASLVIFSFTSNKLWPLILTLTVLGLYSAIRLYLL